MNTKFTLSSKNALWILEVRNILSKLFPPYFFIYSDFAFLTLLKCIIFLNYPLNDFNVIFPNYYLDDSNFLFSAPFALRWCIPIGQRFTLLRYHTPNGIGKKYYQLMPNISVKSLRHTYSSLKKGFKTVKDHDFPSQNYIFRLVEGLAAMFLATEHFDWLSI